MKQFLDFDLSIEQIGNRYRARVLSSPAGQAANDFDSPFAAQDLEIFLLRVGRPRRSVRKISSPETMAVEAFGKRIFNAVFSESVGVCLSRSIDFAGAKGFGLRIRLRLSGASELAEIPWEFLYSSSQRKFFSLSKKTPIVRFLELPDQTRPLHVNGPIKILAMISNPVDEPRLDVELEFKNLLTSLEKLSSSGKVTIHRLEKATMACLQKTLQRGEFHIFHFIGHGGFRSNTDEGVLLFEDDSGKGHEASGESIGTILQDHDSLRLAVLNACEGARNSLTDPFSGVAQCLIQKGLPAVIAMQFEITDRAAISFASEFYSVLSESFPIETALAEARRLIYGYGDNIEWATPVLYLRANDGLIFSVDQVPPVNEAVQHPQGAEEGDIGTVGLQQKRDAEARAKAEEEVEQKKQQEREEQARAEALRLQQKRDAEARAKAEEEVEQKKQQDREEQARAEALRLQQKRDAEARAKAEEEVEQKKQQEREEQARAEALRLQQKRDAEARAKAEEEVEQKKQQQEREGQARAEALRLQQKRDAEARAKAEEEAGRKHLQGLDEKARSREKRKAEREAGEKRQRELEEKANVNGTRVPQEKDVVPKTEEQFTQQCQQKLDEQTSLDNVPFQIDHPTDPPKKRSLFRILLFIVLFIGIFSIFYTHLPQVRLTSNFPYVSKISQIPQSKEDDEKITSSESDMRKIPSPLSEPKGAAPSPTQKNTNVASSKGLIGTVIEATNGVTKSVLENQELNSASMVTNINKSLARKLNEEAIISMRANNYTAAEEKFYKAAKQNWNDVEIVNNLGYILLLQGKFEEAEAPLVRSIKLDKRRDVAWHNLGMLYAARGEEKIAQDCYRIGFEVSERRPSYIKFLKAIPVTEKLPKKVQESALQAASVLQKKL
jgi:tetratricopeptide (TPR) repeat protein